MSVARGQSRAGRSATGSGTSRASLPVARSRRLFERVLRAGSHEPAVDQLAERLVGHEERNREGHDGAAVDAADGARAHQREGEDEGERAEDLARVREQRRARAQA